MVDPLFRDRRNQKLIRHRADLGREWLLVTAMRNGMSSNAVLLLQLDLHIHYLARFTPNRQRHRPAANRAIFDESLLGLRSVDLQWERLSTVRTFNINLYRKIHNYPDWNFRFTAACQAGTGACSS